MKELEPLKLGSLAACYLLWLVLWLVLRDVAFGPQNYSWSQSLVTAVAAGVALRVSRRAPKPYAIFLLLLGVGLLLLAGSWVTYDPEWTRPFLHFEGKGTPSYSDIGDAGFAFTWVCAWGYLAIVEWPRKPPSVLTSVVFASMMFGLGLIFANFYFSEYNSILTTIEGRLYAVIAGLEFLTLSVGLACLLLGQPAVIAWILIATTVLVASDMVYSTVDVPEAIQPIWMFANFLFVGGVLVLPDTVTSTDHDTTRPALAREVSGSQRSGLSGALILLSLGAVLLTVAVWLSSIPAVWRSFFSILFVVVLVVILVWITECFDETVQYLKIYAVRLHRQLLAGDKWRETDGRIRTILYATGLGAYLDTLCNSAAQLKQNVLFLGPERLYPPPKLPGGQEDVRCFLVMPFSLEWSSEVYRILASACKTTGVRAVRGDDLFTPTDILDDIWQAIHGADFVIADITERNPNVLYELGLAHALAKPVLIISRNAKDIPIDLSTRRVILYGQTGPDWGEELKQKASRAINDILRTYGMHPNEGCLEENPLNAILGKD